MDSSGHAVLHLNDISQTEKQHPPRTVSISSLPCGEVLSIAQEAEARSGFVNGCQGVEQIASACDLAVVSECRRIVTQLSGPLGGIAFARSNCKKVLRHSTPECAAPAGDTMLFAHKEGP